MFRRHLVQRTLQLGACGAASVLLFATQAQAAAGAKEKKACMAAYTAYKGAVASEKAGHLREAREQLQTCEQSSCPGLIPKCTAKYAQISSQMPSVVPVVTDDSGAPKVDVQVKMDGELLTSQLDGKGLPVEAGLHEFTFATDAGVFATEKIMIVEGQRNRTVSVVIHTGEKPAQKTASASTPAAPEEPKAEAPDTKTAAPPEAVSDKPAESSAAVAHGGGTERWTMPHSALPYIIGGAGLAGIGAGALLTLWGKKDNDALLAQCGQTDSCSQASVDHIRTLYVASDIAIGAGAVAVGVATWLFASSRTTEQAPASHTAYKVDVQPTPSGAFASVSGAF